MKTIEVNKKDIKIFIINLDRSPDRYNKISKQLDNNNLSYERFSAVDGYNLQMINQDGTKLTGLEIKNNPSLLSFNSHYTIFCPLESINYYTDSKILNRTLSAGEFGCYCSHRDIWFKMVKENIQYAFILEDDAMLDINFYNQYLRVLNNLPAEWNLIYFHVLHSEDKIFYDIYNNPYLKKISFSSKGIFNGASGYLINLKTAKKLLEYSKNFTIPIDDIMQHAVLNRQIEAYVTNPFLITVDPKDSIISEMGRP